MQTVLRELSVRGERRGVGKVFLHREQRGGFGPSMWLGWGAGHAQEVEPLRLRALFWPQG